jgi:hypothetical protein
MSTGSIAVKQEWQPVRLKNSADAARLGVFHTKQTGEEQDWGENTFCRVRPAQNLSLDWGIIHRAETGCDSYQFFEIHPEDVARIWPDDDWGISIICHHSFVTD